VVETYSTSEAVLSHALKVAFVPGGQKDETTPYPFKFKKRGLGLVAVVDAPVIELDKFPGSENGFVISATCYCISL